MQGVGVEEALVMGFKMQQGFHTILLASSRQAAIHAMGSTLSPSKSLTIKVIQRFF
jgi:hypothetical protein